MPPATRPPAQPWFVSALGSAQGIYPEVKSRVYTHHCVLVMTHVVTESCINCKYTDCVDVCPVDCFREGPNFLTIDPDECIDCAVCIPECPVNAIYAEEDTPADQIHMIKLNVELAQKAGWKNITKRKAALPDADDWKDKTGKLPLLQR